MLVSLVSIGINYATAYTMIRFAGFGHAGLAMSTSAVAMFAFLVLFAILRKRIGGVHGRDLAAGIGKVVIASAAMGVACAFSSHGMERWLGVSQLARLADLVVSIPVSLVVFYAMCRVVGVTELDLAIRAFTSPIRRRLPGARRA
jgi:putative peptidoglycan lipid II flippase